MEEINPFYQNAEYYDGTIVPIQPDEYADAWRLTQDQRRTATAPEHYQTPHFDVPEAWALDFDRCLADTDACMERLYTAADAANLTREQFETEVAAAQSRVEQDGGSFDPLALVQARLMPEGVRTDGYRWFEEVFLTSGPDVLFPDARRFVRKLQWSDVPHIIPTYGVNPEWQRLKLAAAWYPVGRKIMDHTDKGIEVADLRSPDGKFHLYAASQGDATYTADVMNLAEDKPSAFNNLPADCGGVLLRRGATLPSQRGNVPDRVHVISSFDELTVDNNGHVIPATENTVEPLGRYLRRLGQVTDERARRFSAHTYAVFLPMDRKNWDHLATPYPG